MPTPLEENKTIGDVLHFEEDSRFSREVIVIASGAGVVEIGAVLGKITASGKYLPRDTDSADGTEVATVVNLKKVDATSADAESLAVVRHAIVKKNGLVWKDGEDAAEIAVGTTELGNQGIVVRLDV